MCLLNTISISFRGNAELSWDQLSLIEYKRMDFRKLTTIEGGGGVGVSGRLEPWGWGEESLINIIISYL